MKYGWIRKAERILREQGLRKADIDRRGGLRRGELAQKMLGTMPGTDIGVKIAQGLGVPAEWLFNDKKGWPPPKTKDELLLDLLQLEVQQVLTTMGQPGLRMILEQLAELRKLKNQKRDIS